MQKCLLESYPLFFDQCLRAHHISFFGCPGKPRGYPCSAADISRTKLCAAGRNYIKGTKPSEQAKSVLAFVLIIYLIYILLDLSTNLNASGQEQGRITVLTRSYAVEVFSKDDLALGSPEVMSDTTPP